jgi:hypothetical protein
MKIPKPLLEALKEGLRVILLAVIPLLISSLQIQKFDWVSIAVVACITALRFVDKYLHEVGVQDKDARLIKGLTQF